MHLNSFHVCNRKTFWWYSETKNCFATIISDHIGFRGITITFFKNF